MLLELVALLVLLCSIYFSWKLFAALLLLFFLFYRLITKNFDHWHKLGVPFKPGKFPWGSVDFLKVKKNSALHQLDMCNQFKDEKFFGFFMFGKPVLMVNDVELVKHIKVKDFSHFVDSQNEDLVNAIRRGGDLDTLFNRNITSAKGDEWKDVRSSLTPIFTSGKMKHMLKFVVDVSRRLFTEMEKQVDQGEFELKELTGRFSLDALASCAFGLDFDSFGGVASNAFVEHAADVFKQDIWTLIFTLKFIPGVSRIFEVLNINVQKPKSVKFFKDIVTQTLKQRSESGQRRNDMIDMMLDIMNERDKEEVEGDMDQYHQDMKFSHKKKRNLTENDIISNLIILLIVGYDTTGMTLAFILYALAENPDVQDKLQQEVDEAWEDAGGSFPDYSKVQGLSYCEMVIMETLRFYTPVAATVRACNEDYRVPGSDLVIKKNDMVAFNATFLHRDPRYWSHPDSFYPVHWTPEEKSQRSPHAFQAFGQGPRACLGQRFALLELKVALAMIMRHLELLPGTKTVKPLELDPAHAFSWVKGGLWAKVKKRDATNA